MEVGVGVGGGGGGGGENREEAFHLLASRQGPPPRKGDREAAFSTTHTGSSKLAGPSNAIAEGDAGK